MEKMEYQTSEKVKVTIDLAGVGERVAAHVVDLAFLAIGFIILYILTIIIVAGMAVFADEDKYTTVLGIVMIILWGLGGLFMLVYPLLFEVIWKGQTPGKRILKLRVVSEDGAGLKFSSLLLRNIFRIVDSLPVFYLVGFISVLLSKQRKRLGDMVAGTILVSEKEPKIPHPVAFNGNDPFAGIPDFEALFTQEDKSAFRVYLESRSQMELVTLLELEKSLAQLVVERSHVDIPVSMSVMDYLNAALMRLKLT